jgi:hypothetical protein
VKGAELPEVSVPHVFMFVNHTRLYDYYGELNFLYWL